MSRTPDTKTRENKYLSLLRKGEELSLQEQLSMIVHLSMPAIVAQLSSIIMQYIDASMVGQLGAGDSASIGLVSTTTWLLGGLCGAFSTGFTVQVAHRIGAGEEKKARDIVRQGLLFAFLFGSILLLLGAGVSPFLPVWLGGNEDIVKNASRYFLIYCLALPVFQLNSIAGGMLQCSGNMKVPSMLHVLMCFLDVIYNALLIFPSRQAVIAGLQFSLPGLGLGVTGAALGTALAELTAVLLMLYFLLARSDTLHLRREEKLQIVPEDLKQALQLAIPAGIESIVTCSAYVAATRIVAPLGTISIAANSFSVTAESLCYMPGYGIGAAATTIIGQSIGAKRGDLTVKLGWITTFFGTVVMAVSGAVMFIMAPAMIGLLSPDPQIQELGTTILRIETFAEPLYGASIVATGVFRGAGDTLGPAVLNFVSMWMVRIPLSAFLAPRFGLRGVWIAMCTELCVRGALFLIRMLRKLNHSGRIQ